MKNIINKENRDKAIAKMIWDTATFITIIAVVVIFAVVGGMVEDMAISFEGVLITAICCAWVACYALFIVWIENLEN